MQTNHIETLKINEMYSIIRFIALEYAAKNGSYSKMYLYVDHKGYPILISTTKIFIFKESVRIYYLPVKHLILYCLYKQYNIENHLGILLHVTRLLERKSEEFFAKELGIDIPTYQALEFQTISKTGYIKKTHGNRYYELTTNLILHKLNIPESELEIHLEDYHDLWWIQ